MYNAAIIIFKRSSLPRILKLLATPSIIETMEIGGDDTKVKVHILECPVLKAQSDNRRVAKQLKDLCLNSSISFFIGRSIEYYKDSGIEQLENSIVRGTIDEIRAIKGLAALIKLSGDSGVSLLKRNMFFMGEAYSYEYISTLSEEAGGVLIYEHEKAEKKVLYEKLMSQKGISAAFTKDVTRAISQCDIIIADDNISLDPYQELLQNKVVIGGKSEGGCIKSITRVTLWYESIEDKSTEDPIIRFNNELLGILRHFCKDKSPIEFIRRFRYIQVN
jgi:hypothetical protein